MRLLIIGTLEGHMTTASQIAMKKGVQVVAVNAIGEAMDVMRAGGADLILMDVRLKIGMMVDQLKQERFSTPVVACGLQGTSADAAVAAIKAGAKEYVPLPPDADLIAAVLEAVSQEDHAIIHRDPAMQATIRLADQIAPSEASVLVTGESGTGKEVMARYIHARSRRAKGRFIALNCAAIPENLLESELFGHEKGAFSGAVARRIGKFEEANGGTLLLDEISEMDVRLQAKLLRAIQEREIDRLGGNTPVKVDVRIIATSNRDMEEHVRKGNFREDLFFRLNVVGIELPSLRERPQDIALLAEHFARKYAELNGVPDRSLSPEAIALLASHPWPGNVRELENALHRAVLLAHGNTIGPEAILLTSYRSAAIAREPIASPGQVAAGTVARTPTGTAYGHPAPAQPQSQTGGPGFAPRTVADVERELILETLGHCLGNRTHAANILGISIRTLRNKLKQYGEEGYSVPAPGESEQSVE